MNRYDDRLLDKMLNPTTSERQDPKQNHRDKVLRLAEGISLVIYWGKAKHKRLNEYHPDRSADFYVMPSPAAITQVQIWQARVEIVHMILHIIARNMPTFEKIELLADLQKYQFHEIDLLKTLENKSGNIDPADVPLEVQRACDDHVLRQLWEYMKNFCAEGTPIEEIIVANRHRTTALFYVLLATFYDPTSGELIDPDNVKKLNRTMPLPTELNAPADPMVGIDFDIHPRHGPAPSKDQQLQRLLAQLAAIKDERKYPASSRVLQNREPSKVQEVEDKNKLLDSRPEPTGKAQREGLVSKIKDLIVVKLDENETSRKPTVKSTIRQLAPTDPAAAKRVLSIDRLPPVPTSKARPPHVPPPPPIPTDRKRTTTEPTKTQPEAKRRPSSVGSKPRSGGEPLTRGRNKDESPKEPEEKRQKSTSSYRSWRSKSREKSSDSSNKWTPAPGELEKTATTTTTSKTRQIVTCPRVG